MKAGFFFPSSQAPHLMPLCMCTGWVFCMYILWYVMCLRDCSASVTRWGKGVDKKLLSKAHRIHVASNFWDNKGCIGHRMICLCNRPKMCVRNDELPADLTSHSKQVMEFSLCLLVYIIHCYNVYTYNTLAINNVLMVGWRWVMEYPTMTLMTIICFVYYEITKPISMHN